MINEIYIDPVEKDFLEIRIREGIKIKTDVCISNKVSTRTYNQIAAQIKKLINHISWHSRKIYLPDIILEDTVDIITYYVAGIELNGVDAYTGEYNITFYVEERTRKNNKKASTQLAVAYSYGLN